MKNITYNNKMSSATIKGKNIDVSKISFSQPRMLDNGAKLVYMNYDGGRLSVQSPWMTLPWKMGVYTEGEYPKYSIDLSFKGMDEDSDLLGFHDKIKAVEEKLINGGINNSVSWFKKKSASREVIEAIFNPVLKVSRDRDTGEPDGKWPPTMKLKISRKNGVWEAGRDRSGREKPLVIKNCDGVTYNINSTEDSDDHTTLDSLFVKNTRIRVKMSCVGLWISAKNYMCQWQLTHAEVDVTDDGEQDNFLPDTDDEADDNTTSTQGSSSGGGVEVEDSDGGSDEDASNGEGGGPAKSPSPEPEPVEPPKIKRKVIRKKKNGDGS